MRVCTCMYVYGHSPQELRRAPRNRSIVVSPLGHYAKRSEEAAKRQGVERQGRTERRSEVETRLLFFVLARPRNPLCQFDYNVNNAKRYNEKLLLRICVKHLNIHKKMHFLNKIENFKDIFLFT